MAFFFSTADNSALLQAIFDQDLAKVRQLLPEADCREGGGRLLRTAVVYSTQAIVEVIAAQTPTQFYSGAVREGLEHNKHLPLIRLIPLAKFKKRRTRGNFLGVFPRGVGMSDGFIAAQQHQTGRRPMGSATYQAHPVGSGPATAPIDGAAFMSRSSYNRVDIGRNQPSSF